MFENCECYSFCTNKFQASIQQKILIIVYNY